MAKNVEGTYYESITGQLFEIGRQLRQPKGYPHSYEQLKRHLQAAVEGRFNIDKPDVESYSIIIDHVGSKTIRNLLKEGKYDRVSEGIIDIIAENFPVKETGMEEVVIHLVHFRRRFDHGDQIIKELKEEGYKSANPAQLLALGAQYPDLQGKFPIAALVPLVRSPWLHSSLYAMHLITDVVNRCMYLKRAELWDGWASHWRFAAVRN